MSVMAAEGGAAAVRNPFAMFEDKGRQRLQPAAAGSASSAALAGLSGGSSGGAAGGRGFEPMQHQQKMQPGHVTAISQQLRIPTAGGPGAVHAVAAAAAAAAAAKQPAQPASTMKPKWAVPAPPPKVLAKGSSSSSASSQHAASSETQEAAWPEPPPEKASVLRELQSQLRVRVEQAVLSQAHGGCAANMSLSDGEVSGITCSLPQTPKVALKPTVSPPSGLPSFKRRPSGTEIQQLPAAGPAAVPAATAAAAAAAMVSSAAAAAAAANDGFTSASTNVSDARAMIGTVLAQHASRERGQLVKGPVPLLPVKPPKPLETAAHAKPTVPVAGAEPAAPVKEVQRTEDLPQWAAHGRKPATAAAPPPPPPLPSKPKPGSAEATAPAAALPSAALHAVTAAPVPGTASLSPSRNGTKVTDSSGAAFEMLPFRREDRQSAPPSKPAYRLDADDVLLPLVLWVGNETFGSAAAPPVQPPLPQQQQQAALVLRRAITGSGKPSSRGPSAVVSLIEPTTEAEEYDDCLRTTARGPASPLLSSPPPSLRPGLDNRALPPLPGTTDASKGVRFYDDTTGPLYDDTTGPLYDDTQGSASTASSDSKGATSAAQKESKQHERELEREIKRREKEEREQREREEHEQAKEKERRDRELDKMSKIRQALQKDQEKIRKRFKLTGDETYVRLVTMKSSYVPKPGKEELPFQTSEVMFVIVKEGCPKGKWLARNSENLLGFINSDQVVTSSVSSELGSLNTNDTVYDDAGQMDELEDEVYAEAD